MIYHSFAGPLPSTEGVLAATVRETPSWWVRMGCARCGRERWLHTTHMALVGLGDLTWRDVIPRLRHKGCGGEPAWLELLNRSPIGEEGPKGRVVRLVG